MMKKVLVSLVVFIGVVSASNAAVIPGVTATGTNTYIANPDSFTWGGVNGNPNNLVDGSGFDEEMGWHYNDGFRGYGYDESGKTLWLNGQGNMWIASMDPLPSVTFDLGSVQTLTAIKVWNFNHSGHVPIIGLGNASSRETVGRLDMGVQDMDIVVLDGSVADANVLATFENVHLDPAPGRDDDNFGQLIDIAALNGNMPVTGARGVKFNIQSNYGDAAGQVGLSEVRFYNNVDVTLDAGPDQTVWIVDSGSAEPNSVVVTMAGTATAASTTWFAYPQQTFYEQGPGDVVIADANALDTTVTITAPGIYYFILIDDDNYAFTASGPMGRFSGVYDTVKIRVLASETDEGLIGYWPLDGNSNDATGNEHNLTLSGGPVLEANAGVTGVAGDNALRFNRSGAAYTNDPDLDPGSLPEEYLSFFSGQMAREFTISYWCKVDGTLPTDEPTLGLFDLCGNIRMWSIGKAINFGITTQPFSSPEYFGDTRGMGATSIIDGDWHFVTLTFDGFSFKLYIDGRLDAEQLQYGTEVYSGSAGTLRIGARSNNSLSFVGLIDDVKVYRVAKDQQYIANAYKSAGTAFKPCATLYAGDANGDCQVDIDDLVMLANNWLQ